MEDGTGIVHIAPAFGEDDARVGRKYDAPFVQMVDEAGVMKPETPFAGMRAKPTKKEMEAGAINCDVEVLKELEGRGILFSAPKVEHEILIAGDVIHHLSTMQESHGLSR